MADPHANEPVLRLGPDVADSRLVAICIHGRGASAEDILVLAREFGVEDVAFLAPQAAGNSWYPYSFLQPIARNEPGLTSGLKKISSIFEAIASDGVGGADARHPESSESATARRRGSPVTPTASWSAMCSRSTRTWCDSHHVTGW